MSKRYIIYKATNLINGKCYVGQTTGALNKRRNNHISYKGRNQYYFHKALSKYGKENFTWDVIFECDDPLMLNVMETFKIMVCHSHHTENGYNLTWGGDGNSGFIISEETKRKIGEARKGHTHTEESKRKIGESHKGKIISEEQKRKISEILKGRIISEDHKRKISEANKGHSVSAETRKKISDTEKGRVVIISEDHKRKISEANKGRIVSEETRRKISNGERGKVVSEETKEKIRDFSKSRQRNKNGEWLSLPVSPYCY